MPLILIFPPPRYSPDFSANSATEFKLSNSHLENDRPSSKKMPELSARAFWNTDVLFKGMKDRHRHLHPPWGYTHHNRH